MLTAYYPIDPRYNAVFQQLPQQAFTLETIQPHFEKLGEKVAFLLNLAAFIQNKEHDIATLKERETYLRQERQLAEQQVTTLKKYCVTKLQESRLNYLENTLLSLHVQQNCPKVLIDNIEQLPTIYIARIEPHPDKIRIRSDLLQGIAVPGSRLVFDPYLKITAKK